MPTSGATVAQIAVPEAVGQHAEGEQRREQRLHAEVAEAQRGGALAVDDARPVEVVERFGADGAVVADMLDAQQASVGGEADPFEIIEVLQPSADIEVVGVVDHRLGPQCAALLVVLLDAGVLVVDVQRRGDPVGCHAGPVPRGGAFGDASVPDTTASASRPSLPLEPMPSRLSIRRGLGTFLIGQRHHVDDGVLRQTRQPFETSNAVGGVGQAGEQTYRRQSAQPSPVQAPEHIRLGLGDGLGFVEVEDDRRFAHAPGCKRVAQLPADFLCSQGRCDGLRVMPDSRVCRLAVSAAASCSRDPRALRLRRSSLSSETDSVRSDIVSAK